MSALLSPATPSASVLLLRQRSELEVLMVVRSAAPPFASAMVFPGGKLDEADRAPEWLELAEGADGLDQQDRALRIAAWRELFEETGIAPFACAFGDTAPFPDLVRRAGAKLNVATMVPFARWITPDTEPRRFDTHFFLCALDGDALCDGRETIAAEWLSPGAALALGASGERRLLFPTRSQLRRLAGAGSVEQALAEAARSPVVPIQPRIEARPEGRTVVIPEGLGYAVCEELF